MPTCIPDEAISRLHLAGIGTDASDPALGVGSATASQLVSLAARVRAFDAASAGEDAALEMVRAVEAGIRPLQGYETVVAARLAVLSDAGSGVSVEDAFAVAGKLSDRDARKTAKRARLTEHLPLLAAAVMAGTALTENVDAVARARHRLRHNSDWVRAFDTRDAAIATKAAGYRPRKFATWITGVTDMISDDGATNAATERDANRVRTWRTGDGRVRANINLDSETGARFLFALDAQAKSLAARRKQAGETFHLDDHHQHPPPATTRRRITPSAGQPAGSLRVIPVGCHPDPYHRRLMVVGWIDVGSYLDLLDRCNPHRRLDRCDPRGRGRVHRQGQANSVPAR